MVSNTFIYMNINYVKCVLHDEIKARMLFSHVIIKESLNIPKGYSDAVFLSTDNGQKYKDKMYKTLQVYT